MFVAELGNDSVGVIKLFKQTLERTITGVPGPQGVIFSPEANKLFVASGPAEKLYIMMGLRLISSRHSTVQVGQITSDMTRSPSWSTSVVAKTRRPAPL